MNKEILKGMTDAELILMQNDLRRFPDDKDSLHDVMKELGRRETHDSL